MDNRDIRVMCVSRRVFKRWGRAGLLVDSWNVEWRDGAPAGILGHEVTLAIRTGHSEARQELFNVKNQLQTLT